MKYQAFPAVGTHTNRLLVYDPADADKEFNYRHTDGVLRRPQGAWYDEHFNPPKTYLQRRPDFRLDACRDFTDYTRNTYRGRRRTHALVLAAAYHNKPVLVFEKWLTEEALRSFDPLINKLRALCLGVPLSFGGLNPREPLYQINKPIMEQVLWELELIRKRTIQLNPDRREDIPELPLWSDTKTSDFLIGIYSQNDWEIMAATFRAEAETFLQCMLYLGYDFVPFEPEEERFDLNSELLEEEEDSTPPPLSEAVQKLLEESMASIAPNSPAHFVYDRPEVVKEPVAVSSPAPSTEPMMPEVPSLKGQGELETVPEEIPSFQFPTSDEPRGPVTSTPHPNSARNTTAAAETSAEPAIITAFQLEQVE